MKKIYSFQEILENRLNGRSTVDRPVIKAKPILAATPEELDRLIRTVAKRVIVRHREELKRLASK